MTTLTIITLTGLLILAYVFDLSASKTKIPSVILLLLVGWAAQQGVQAWSIKVPHLDMMLPILGTIGLVLIVLEGSLELELNASKITIVRQSIWLALVPLVAFSLGLGQVFAYVGATSFKNGLVNAIPFAVISSAIAIPSAQHLLDQEKELVTYETSFSDIFGVMLFNFIALNDSIGWAAVGYFMVEILLIFIITGLATLVLTYLLSQITHPVKFVPIILMVVWVYALTKLFHLPGLVFILLFGLFLGNLHLFKKNRYFQLLRPDILHTEVHKFKELTTEIAFLVRALFFLLFGYLMETQSLLNVLTISWALGICSAIYALRWLSLRLFRLPINPYIFIAPRGLITILLFLSIPSAQATTLANKSLVIQVILLAALVMMVGLMLQKSPAAPSSAEPSHRG
ncbi:MAG TPA: sodium:proton antiporter [Microscillaceae bacterium]|jgi:hypothetical protein|nr:sodium:proton antiporter [Microscillaceae bacterium]